MRASVLCWILIVSCPPAAQADEELRPRAERALRRAVTFFQSQVATQGGYLWAYSGDLKLREGERAATETMIWVQPPGTPSVGEALLDAYEATSDKLYLQAARAAGQALVRGQLHSGGWSHSIDFHPARRAGEGYRDQPPVDRPRRRTTLDDDTTQAAVRFLIRLDRVLGFKDRPIHDAASHALSGLVAAQRPNGGWSVQWDLFPQGVADRLLPALPASYPDSWPRTWPNTFDAVYVLNDDLMPDLVDTLLLAHDTSENKEYLDAVVRAGDFLILAQMPEPQPAWAQQYSRQMHPTWARRFEPPAITGAESQGVLRTLMTIYRRTGRKSYLEPIPRAVAYLKKSRLEDGRLARFYELKTNRPLYFTQDYRLTYSADDLPRHYGFRVSSRLDRIEEELRHLLTLKPEELAPPRRAGPARPGKPSSAQIKEVERVIDALDQRGAWIEKGALRTHPGESSSGVIRTQTFITNVRTLARYLAGTR